ncbi:MAG: tRNA (adenosine(37)-N6)-threonylcarbamoyltransferase complex dimerization subunit type 1 TsaB [Alistipes sp.]|jgi:tRNA threonylcarbamoyladenosine biosynthesis protein TsaB|nr:tRNA (adenosine(37)-N6)-threonylcarbamoyltransferase complex dimerization subunit type 1 TsaB [Alistipes sp.]
MSAPQYILCIETGTDTCSVALAADGRLAALRESHGERDHAARVAVYTAEVLAEAGIAAGDLSAVAVSKGPGSYTGLRIGVSFAKGLCYGLGIPLIGVGSLDSLCAVARGERMESAGDATAEFRSVSRTHSPERNRALFVPMIDARRMEVYGQVFDPTDTPLTEPEAWIIDENSLAEYRDRDVVIFGSGAEKCRESLPWARFTDVQPSAKGMIELATDALRAGRKENTAYFEPFYLKDFVVTTSTKKLF